MHRLFAMLKREDTTHKWYALGTPEKALDELKPVAEQKPIALLIRQPQGNETLGTFICINSSGVKVLKSVERVIGTTDPYGIVAGTCTCKYTFSPKFQKYTYEVLGVPNRVGIRIHSGNYSTDSEGCIILGLTHADINNDGIIDVASSRDAIAQLENFFGREDFTLIII